LAAGVLLAGAGAALVGDALAGVVCLFAVAALLAGALRPRLLVPLVAAGCVILPPYVGWLLPGGSFVNLQRGVMYGGALGVGVWALRERMDRRWLVPGLLFEYRPLRISFLLLAAAWLAAPIVGLALGPANAARALNAGLYQALAFWVGLSFTQDVSGRRLLQLTFALLLAYTVPFWLYEVQTGRGLFAWYVPPLPNLLTGRFEVLRGGLLRPAATFGHPLAFGQFLLIATPVAFSLVYSRLPRVFSLALLVVGVAALLATQSRSPWIALALAAIALVILRRRKLRAALVVTALLLAIGAIPLVQAWQSHALAGRAKAFVTTKYSPRTEAELSAVGRVFLTLGGLKVVRSQPLVGYGFDASAPSTRSPSWDDYYLLLAVQQGLVVAGLVSLALLVGWYGVARAGAGPEAVCMILAAGAYLVEWLFVGLHDTSPLLFLILGHLFGSGSAVRDSAGEAGSLPSLIPEGGG